MKNEDTKERLLAATIRLLQSGQEVDTITARQICAESETNLAMINYFYKSKEALMNLAVQSIIAAEAVKLDVSADKNLPPREQLRRALIALCDTTAAYRQYARVTIPYILLQDEIKIPLTLLPLLRRHFGTSRSEEECRIIAYEFISFSQLVFLRAEDFLSYSGMDIFDAEQRSRLIDMQLDLFLGKEEK